MNSHPLSSVVGGDPEYNASTCTKLLNNELQIGHPILDYVLMNASALLVISGKAVDWKSGVNIAQQSIVSGSAKAVLEKFKQASHHQ